MAVLLDHEKMAISFLSKAGQDQVGDIDSEEKLAAIFTYMGLIKKWYVIGEINGGGPIYRLTNKGKITASNLKNSTVPW